MPDNWIIGVRSDTLQKRLIADLEANNFTDVTFRVGADRNSRTFHAHRFVLASESSELRKLFDESKPGTIEIPDVHPKAFENLVRYSYDRSFLFEDFESTCETLRAAKKFKIEGLQSAVEENLVHLTESESPTKVLAFCEQLNLPGAAKRCREAISSRVGKVSQTSESEMSSEAMERISSSDPGHETMMEGERLVDCLLESVLIDEKSMVSDQTETSKLDGEKKSDLDYDSDSDDFVMEETVIKDMIDDASQLITNCMDDASKETIDAIVSSAEQLVRDAADKFQKVIDDMMDNFTDLLTNTSKVTEGKST